MWGRANSCASICVSVLYDEPGQIAQNTCDSNDEQIRTEESLTTFRTRPIKKWLQGAALQITWVKWKCRCFLTNPRVCYMCVAPKKGAQVVMATTEKKAFLSLASSSVYMPPQRLRNSERKWKLGHAAAWRTRAVNEDKTQMEKSCLGWLVYRNSVHAGLRRGFCGASWAGL